MRRRARALCVSWLGAMALVGACSAEPDRVLTTGSTTSTSSTGQVVCEAGAIELCYDGPAETLGKGFCVEGVRACSVDGMVLGPCAGQILPVSDNCETEADEDCDGRTPACPPPSPCSRVFGDTIEQSRVAGLAVDANGAMIVAGHVGGSVDFGAGPTASLGFTDAFIVKYGPACDHRWSKRFGDYSDQLVTDVAVDPFGNVLVAGSFVGSTQLGGIMNDPTAYDSLGSIASLDASGHYRWSRNIGGYSTGYVPYVGLAAAPNGETIAAITFAGNINLGDPSVVITSNGSAFLDVLLAKLGPDGEVVTSVLFGGPSGEGAGAVATGPSGEIAMTGQFSGTTSMGGPTLQGAGADAFVVKLDAAGAHLWSRAIGGAGEDSGYAVAVGADGSVVVAGDFEGTADCGTGPLVAANFLAQFVCKYSSDGTPLWGRAIDASYVSGLAIDADLAVVVTGSFLGTLDVGTGPITADSGGAFVAKLDGSGVPMWAKGFGESAFGIGVAVDAQGVVDVTGTFNGAVDFGQGAHESSGNDWVFVARLPPP